MLEAAAVQLGEYFAGERTDFDVPVKPRGHTIPERRVGRTQSAPVRGSGLLRRARDRSPAARAPAGRWVAPWVRTRVPIIVPCHQVLAGNRRITGYSGGEGIPTKVWLLDHEGIEHVA